MKKKRIIISMLTLVMSLTMAAQGLTQDGEGYYLIGSLQDWKDFATLVQTTPTANAKMTADVNLGDDQTKIASGDIYYQGTFDGQGYSLTIAYEETDGSSQHVAPFVKIQNATIQNLHVKGSINTAGMRPAGITSYVKGTSYIRNCWSEVDITSSYGANILAGGIVACIVNYNTLYMDDSFFYGSITLGNSNGYMAGGLIGWKEGYAYAYLTHCLSAPKNISSVRSSEDNNVLISGISHHDGTTPKIKNCYYVNVGSSTTWAKKGKEAQGSQLADGSLAYMLQAFRDQLNWGQKLGTDAAPVPFITDENSRVYRAYSGGFTNASAEGYVFHQDTDDYYIVGTSGEWQDLAIQVELTPNINAKMTADINIGDDQIAIPTYQGIFDGQGHTLTVNLTATSKGYGPFLALNRGTIKNLHVTGTITTSYCYVGGIVGLSIRNGTNTLTNCWSSVTLKSTTSGADHIGGFVGETDDYDTLIMNDCLFDGSFDGSNTSEWGGFVGLNYYSTVNISNSLFAPASVNIKGGFCTFSNNWGGSTQTNCFTSVSGNTTQGVLVTEDQMASGNVAYLLQKGRNDLIWAQEIGSDTHPHPLPFSDNSSRVYSAAGGGYTNDPAQAGSDLVLDFTIVDNGDITIKGFRSDFTPPSDYALDIPDEIGGYPVIAIGNNAFKQKSTIISLNIGRNVQSIGSYAFQECTGLQSLEIPNNVTSFGDRVFTGCTSMATVTFEEGCQLTRFPSETFCNCSSLKEIEIPSSVTSISGWVFWNCTSLTSLTIPVNVKSLDGDGIWYGCANMTILDLSKATQIAVLYTMTSINRNSGIFRGIPANCDVILPYGCKATGNHVAIAEPDENSIGIADDGYYELSKPEHWKVFSAIAQAVPTANARLTADIDLGYDQTMIGTESVPYKGTFDGQGHTLTVNWTTTGDYCAPFPCINGATFKNLHVTGTINTSHRYTGGLIGKSIGTSYIKNCRSSVEMISSYNGDAVRGGFAASVGGGSLNFNDCIFDGKFEGASSQTWGGFVGWKNSYTVNIENGLFVPMSVNVSAKYSATFSGNGGTVNNSYYTVQINNSDQGTLVSAEQLADGSIAYRLQAGRADLVWGQRIGTDDKDDMPLLTNDESYRVYRSKNGGYTNDPTLAYEGLQQDVDGNYLIGSLAGWQEFAEIVNSDTNKAANAKMTADIDLGDDQTTIGTNDSYYQGTFDGQGHTLTVNLTTTQDGYGPFLTLNGATIKNLHVTGTITDDSYQSFGGIAGYIGGPSTLTNCWSSVTLKSTFDLIHGSRIGGIVAGTSSTDNSITTLNMSDCLFDGKLEGTNNSNSNWSGLVGWIYNTTVNISNSLFAPASVDINGKLYTIYGNFLTFNESGSTLANLYTTMAGSSSTYTQGTVATSEELADGTTTANLQNGRSEVIWVQDPVANQPMLAVFVNAVKLGDVNGDHNIDENDLDVIVKIVMGETPPGIQEQAGDLNNDGKVDAADVVKMVDILNSAGETQAASALSEATTDDIGKIVGADGKIYDNATAALDAGTTAAAIIAYVGSAGSVDASSASYKGLAIAMSDANSSSTCAWYTDHSGSCVSRSDDIATAITYKNGIECTNTLVNSNGTGVTTTCSGHYHAAAIAARNNNGIAAPTGTSDWFLPSLGQWNLIVQGLATKKTGSAVTTNLSESTNSTYYSFNLNSVITDVGGTGFRSALYGSSSEYDAWSSWHMHFAYGSAGCTDKSGGKYVRSVIAF